MNFDLNRCMLLPVHHDDYYILRFMETSWVLGLGQRNIDSSTSILSVVENHSFWLQLDAVSHTKKRKKKLKAHCDNSNAVSPLGACLSLF